MLNKIDSGEGYLKNHHIKLRSSVTDHQLQQFSCLKSDEERFNFVHKLPAAHEPEIRISSNGKNGELAKKLKDEGNKAFQSGDFKSALSLYSKGIFKTPWDKDFTLDLAVAIANRSAALYHLEHHQLAVQDIDIVLTLDYPSELRYKVLDRKARCYLATKQLKDALGTFQATLSALDSAKLPLDRKRKWQTDVQIMLAMLSKNALDNAVLPENSKECFPRTSGGRNPSYQSASSAVKIRQNNQMGRFAEANRDIKAGDTLVVEQAHCAVLLAEYRFTNCFHCLKKMIAPVPCPNCCVVGFCSISCRQVALSSHHAVECGVLETLWRSGVSVTSLMAFRILSQRGLEHFLQIKNSLQQELGENKTYRSSDYLTVYNLVRHEDRRTPEDFLHRADMAVFLFRCLKVSGFFTSQAIEQDLTTDEVFIGGLLLRHLQLLQFNAHEISELQLEKGGKLDTGRSVFLGGGLYPTLALFNHSCDPGITRYFQETSVVVRAVKPIHCGEMIAENYGPIFTQVGKAERQATLKSQYWFDCLCTPCQENWPLFKDMNPNLMRFRCDVAGENKETAKCTNVIVVPTDTAEFMVYCSACQGHTNIFKGLKALQDTDALFRTATRLFENGDVSKALAKFLETLALVDETLAPPFRDFHLCQQGVRRCMLSLGNQRVCS